MSEHIARRRFLQGLTAVPAVALLEPAATRAELCFYAAHSTQQLSTTCAEGLAERPRLRREGRRQHSRYCRISDSARSLRSARWRRGAGSRRRLSHRQRAAAFEHDAAAGCSGDTARHAELRRLRSDDGALGRQVDSRARGADLCDRRAEHRRRRSGQDHRQSGARRTSAARRAAASSGADRVHSLQRHSPRRLLDRVQEHVVRASDVVREHHDQEPDDSHRPAATATASTSTRAST